MNQPSHSARRAEGAAVAQTAADLAALSRMTGAELAEKYLVLFGQSARTHNKDFLRKRLAWRIQELAEGGLSERALARIEELGGNALATWRRPVRTGTPAASRPQSRGAARDPRLPPEGKVLLRTLNRPVSFGRRGTAASQSNGTTRVESGRCLRALRSG